MSNTTGSAGWSGGRTADGTETTLDFEITDISEFKAIDKRISELGQQHRCDHDRYGDPVRLR